MTYEQLLKRTYDHQDTLEQVVSTINMSDDQRLEYFRRIRLKYEKKRFNLSIQYHDKIALEEQYSSICKLENPNFKLRVMYWSEKNFIVFCVYKILLISNKWLYKFRIRKHKS